MPAKRKLLKDTKEKALACARAALDKKAEDLRVLNVRELSSFCDFFIICSGHSTRHVQAIAQAIEEDLRQEVHPRGIEGLAAGQWVLMDYGDVIIHIFYTPTREFYDLDSLWNEAETLEVTESE